MTEHYLDFGGVGPLLQLATANGFPPESYRPLATYLTTRQRVLAYRSRPLWPGSYPEQIQSWRDLAQDLLHDMASIAPPGGLIGMGHSLGGIMTMYAALQRPEYFRALVLVDPVIMPRLSLPLLWLLRQFNMDHMSPLARGARRRRTVFASVAIARERFQGRGVFTDFSPTALEGYLEGGLRANGDGSVTLAWPSAWESRIFSLVPIDTWDAVARAPQPLLLIRGKNSDLIIDRSWRQLQRYAPNAELVEIDGGHMVPMERPQLVAEAVHRFLDRVF
ncbi:MAG: alpha/beta hydrolase [Chloroflexales bacterium]|nr:alpha/beta hydrolase [Chloroflexales bacterium]